MNENILQSFKSESAPCIKLLSLKRKCRLWIIETSRFLKRQYETLAYCPPTCWSFRVGLNENANSFFATRCRFWSGKNCWFPGNTVHKAARSQTLLYQALQAWWNENETNHRRLVSSKGGVWKNESLNKSFGSLWENKVKINAYYKTIKMFFELACMSTCCWGHPKPKYEPFITHNRGTLKVQQEKAV